MIVSHQERLMYSAIAAMTLEEWSEMRRIGYKSLDTKSPLWAYFNTPRSYNFNTPEPENAEDRAAAKAKAKAKAMSDKCGIPEDD